MPRSFLVVKEKKEHKFDVGTEMCTPEEERLRLEIRLQEAKEQQEEQEHLRQLRGSSISPASYTSSTDYQQQQHRLSPATPDIPRAASPTPAFIPQKHQQGKKRGEMRRK